MPSRQPGADRAAATTNCSPLRTAESFTDARARHQGSGGYSPAERADFLLGRAVFLEKYRGFGAGLQARLSAIFGTLFSFRFGEFSRTISGQKIDGTQT